jgi:hypothetical protein
MEILGEKPNLSYAIHYYKRTSFASYSSLGVVFQVFTPIFWRACWIDYYHKKHTWKGLSIG